MSRWSKVSLAGFALLMIAIPASVVVAGGNSSVSDVNNQSAAWNGRAEASKQWKPVPGLIVASGDNTLVATNVSAQMTRGKAKFRIVPVAGGAAVEPGPVLFSSRAANSFTWARDASCPGQPYRVEWKRVGKRDAIASRLSSHSVLDEFCL